jgi:hypothetical protein
MTEDVVVPSTTVDKSADVVEVSTTVPSVPELSPVVQQAMDQGWLPKEDWVAAGRDPEEHRSAKEFVERGELYKSIHTTKRELKQTQTALDALQRHHRYVFEKAHQQAIRDLRAEKRLAIRNDDIDRLEEIETEIEQLQDQHVKEVAAVQEQAAAAQPAPEFQNFVDRNPWYLTDKMLRDEADAAGFIFLNNGNDRSGLFAHVEKEMKRKFPDKFGVKRAAPNAVAGVDRSGKKGPKQDSFELSSEERQVMMTFVNQGIMSEADYIKELKKVGR